MVRLGKDWYKSRLIKSKNCPIRKSRKWASTGKSSWISALFRRNKVMKQRLEEKYLFVETA